MRGDHRCVRARPGPFWGPTLHARGPREVVQRGLGSQGTNPACAGTTRTPPTCGVFAWDQPRMRGEHDAALSYAGQPTGPTPHARGPQEPTRGFFSAVDGFYPLCQARAFRRCRANTPSVAHHCPPGFRRAPPRCTAAGPARRRCWAIFLQGCALQVTEAGRELTVALGRRVQGRVGRQTMSSRTFPVTPCSSVVWASAVRSRGKRCKGRPASSPTRRAPASTAAVTSVSACCFAAGGTV